MHCQWIKEEWISKFNLDVLVKGIEKVVNRIIIVCSRYSYSSNYSVTVVSS